MLIRPSLILACVLLACQSHAQSWDTVRGLQARANIKVLDTAGTEYRGAFASVSGDSLSLDTAKGRISLDRPGIRRVQLRSGSRRVRNAVIGAAIGIAVGVAVDQTLGVLLRNEGNESSRALMYAGPIALFAGLGGAFPAYRTIYRNK